MLSILALGVALGAAATLVSGSTEKEETAKEKEATVTYDKEYCREHLSVSSYDNWEVQTVAKALQSSRVRNQLERYLNHYDFERAVDELVKDGEIRL